MISWDRVRELKEEVGEADFAEIVALFLSETEEALAQLGSATDPDEAEALLHSLKGSAVNLGFDDMSALCRAGRGRAVVINGWPEDHAELFEIYMASKERLLSET